MRERESVRVCVCMCIRLCILDREGNRVFASRAQAVVQTVVYLTGFTFNDCLAGFCEPLLPPLVIDVMPV